MTTQEKVISILDTRVILGHQEEMFSEIMSIIEEEKNIKVCTGCGRRSDNQLPETALACCPDSNYITLNDYLKKSAYRPDLFKD